MGDNLLTLRLWELTVSKFQTFKHDNNQENQNKKKQLVPNEKMQKKQPWVPNRTKTQVNHTMIESNETAQPTNKNACSTPKTQARQIMKTKKSKNNQISTITTA